MLGLTIRHLLAFHIILECKYGGLYYYDLKKSKSMKRYFVIFYKHKRYTRNVAYYCLTLFLMLEMCSCGSSSSPVEEKLTVEQAIDTFSDLSPTEGAHFYMDNREQYPFLDTLYVSYVIPIVGECCFDTIKMVKDVVGKTPADSALLPSYAKERKTYLAQIDKEIKENAVLQKQTFVNCIIPTMQVEIDSLLEEDMDKVIDKYAGGFLNIRKLKFFFGTDSKDFAELWNKNIDNEKYTKCVAKYIDTYLDSLAVMRNDYYVDIVNSGEFESDSRISQATMDLLLAKKCVRQVDEFTKNEIGDMSVSIFKDFVVPAVLGASTGGVGTMASWVYDAGNLCYDVKVSLDDIKSQKLEPEDVLKYACMENIGFQIRQAYLKYYTQRVFRNIDENSQKLYESIEEKL